MYFRYPFFLAFGFDFVVTILIRNSLVSVVVVILSLPFFFFSLADSDSPTSALYSVISGNVIVYTFIYNSTFDCMGDVVADDTSAPATRPHSSVALAPVLKLVLSNHCQIASRSSKTSVFEIGPCDFGRRWVFKLLSMVRRLIVLESASETKRSGGE